MTWRCCRYVLTGAVSPCAWAHLSLSLRMGLPVIAVVVIFFPIARRSSSLLFLTLTNPSSAPLSPQPSAHRPDVDLLRRRGIVAMSAASSSCSALRRRGTYVPLIPCPDCGRTVHRGVSGTPEHPGWVYYKCHRHGVGLRLNPFLKFPCFALSESTALKQILSVCILCSTF